MLESGRTTLSTDQPTSALDGIQNKVEFLFLIYWLFVSYLSFKMSLRGLLFFHKDANFQEDVESL